MEIKSQEVIVKFTIRDFNGLKTDITDLLKYYSKERTDCNRRYKYIDTFMNMEMV